MKSGWKLLANLLMISHFLFTGALIALGALGWFVDEWYIGPLLIAVTLTLFSQVAYDGDCPLTVWQERARKKYDPQFTMKRSFNLFYVNKFLGISLTNEGTDIFFKFFYFMVYFVSVAIILF